MRKTLLLSLFFTLGLSLYSMEEVNFSGIRNIEIEKNILDSLSMVRNELGIKRDFTLNIRLFNNFESYSSYLKGKSLEVVDYNAFIKENFKNEVLIYSIDNRINLVQSLTLGYLYNLNRELPPWLSLGVSDYLSLKLTDNLDSKIYSIKAEDSKVTERDRVWIDLASLDRKGSLNLIYDLLLLKDGVEKGYSKVVGLLDNYDIGMYETIRDITDKGISKYQNGEFKGAEKLLRDSEYSDGLYYRGLSLIELGRVEEGLESLENSIKKGAPEDRVYYSIAIVLYNRGKYDLAAEYFKKVDTNSSHFESAKSILKEMKGY